MDLKTIKYIIEALRTSPVEPGIYRDPGFAPRRMAGPLLGGGGKLKSELEYGKYRKIQDAIGETPVSYDEFTGGQ